MKFNELIIIPNSSSQGGESKQSLMNYSETNFIFLREFLLL